jgi:ATPase subunit of ABC transporter with duplicated ATPase domains
MPRSFRREAEASVVRRLAMFRLDNVTKQHGSRILLVDAACAVNRGEKVGLVGPNGAGKSTIFRMVVKEDVPDVGNVVLDKGTLVGYFSQDVGDMQGKSVVGEAMDGAGPVSEAGQSLRELEAALADPARMDEMDTLVVAFGDAQARYEELGGYALEARAREILAGLGFSQAMMDQDVGAMSGGWKMRVALARILLMKPDLLLLDEPTNHLDIESILWLETFLKGFEGALVMTCHDRAFMNRVVSKIIEIDGGELTTYSGDYEFYERQRKQLEAQKQAQYERQQAMLAKEEAFIARFKARASHAAQVQSRVKKLEKIDKVEPPRRHQTIQFEFQDAPRSGDDVAKLENVSKRYGERVIYQDFSMLVRRTERWCVMGINGAGKSTLLKLIAEVSKADSGNVKVGASVKMGYFAQHSMDVLSPNESVWDSLVSSFPKASIGSLRSLAGAFGFSGDDIEKECRVLSGGEKARLVLAKMMYDPPNFLVLDEPTNHLDIHTKEMMIETLKAFTGTMLFVSHDRHFLRALSNRVLEVTPNADGPRLYGGGYAEYVEQVGYEAPGMRH